MDRTGGPQRTDWPVDQIPNSPSPPATGCEPTPLGAPDGAARESLNGSALHAACRKRTDAGQGMELLEDCKYRGPMASWHLSVEDGTVAERRDGEKASWSERGIDAQAGTRGRGTMPPASWTRRWELMWELRSECQRWGACHVACTLAYSVYRTSVQNKRMRCGHSILYSKLSECGDVRRMGGRRNLPWAVARMWHSLFDASASASASASQHRDPLSRA